MDIKRLGKTGKKNGLRYSGYLLLTALSLGATLARAAVAPAEVWVDDNYALQPNGSPVAWPYAGPGTGPHTIGVDAFASVQAALDAMSPFGKVWVAPGEYRENIAVEKPCMLIGPNAGKAGTDPSRGPEAILMPGVDDPYQGQIMYLRISGVSVDGFVLDGHNSELVASETIGGVTVNTSAAIQNSWFWWQETWAKLDHITIANNVIKNIFYDGVYWDVGLGSTDSWNYITNNVFDNVWEGVQTYGPHTVIADNTFTNVTRGLSLHGTIEAPQAGFEPAVLRNQITIRNPADWMDFRGVGIWVNYRRGNAPAIEVAENTISFSQFLPEGKVGYGLWALSVDSGRSVAFRANKVTGNGRRTVGFLASTIDPAANVSVTGGQLNNAGFGVLAGRKDIQWGDGPARVALTNVLIAPSTGGTGLCATVSYTAGDWSQIEVSSGTTVNGGAVSVACFGGAAHVLFQGSNPAYLNSPALNYVHLGSNGATPSATDIDARQVKFDGIMAAAMTPPQIALTESKILDRLDNPTLGLVCLNDQPWLGLTAQPGGALLSAHGINGQSCTLEATIDFVSWTTLHTASMPFDYPDSSALPFRFYRIKTP